MLYLLDRLKLDYVWFEKLCIDSSFWYTVKGYANRHSRSVSAAWRSSQKDLWHPSTVLASHHLTGISGCLWLRWSEGCQTEWQPGICLSWIVNCRASVLHKQQSCWHEVQCFSRSVCYSYSIDRMLLNCPNFTNKGFIKGIMSCVAEDKHATIKMRQL